MFSVCAVVHSCQHSCHNLFLHLLCFSFLLLYVFGLCRTDTKGEMSHHFALKRLVSCLVCSIQTSCWVETERSCFVFSQVCDVYSESFFLHKSRGPLPVAHRFQQETLRRPILRGALWPSWQYDRRMTAEQSVGRRFRGVDYLQERTMLFTFQLNTFFLFVLF